MFECGGDTEHGRFTLMLGLEDRRQRRAFRARALNRDDARECRRCRGRDTTEKELGLRSTHADGTPACEHVAVHTAAQSTIGRVPPSLSVIIAALNEEPFIAAAVSSSFEAGAKEVIVVDGGSSDRTIETAVAAGASVIQGEPMRARQSNMGAAVATGDVLLFLHADTTLPPGASSAVLDAVGAGAHFGGFRLRFREQSAGLRFTAWMINHRSAITRCPWGDQAQFVARSAFEGFREIPLMEDYELALRMKRRGRVAILRQLVTTSGRRFLQRGFVRTWLTNWWIIALYRAGVAPERLAQMYRKS
jgi:rSAM/selenodomain-associated transferase 2